MARLIVPSLAAEDRTEDKARALLSFISEPSLGTAIPGLPYFAHLSAIRAEIVRRIRRGIAGREFEEVAGSAEAIEVWAGLYSLGNADGLPEQLFEHLVTAIETHHNVGLHALIECARKLIELKHLRADHGPRLEEALGDLIDTTSYEKVDSESKEATSISLVRAACVRLARALQTNGAGGTNASAWLEAASTDPLPEVRFALT